MATLGQWQRLDRVLPGLPFGSGADGSLVVSSDTTQAIFAANCSGTAGSTALSYGSTNLSNGNIILIHQTRGGGVGQWEINKVSSGGGTTNIVCAVPLHYSYSGSAQAVKIPMYTSVTVNSGITWTIKSWDGNTGGILAFGCKGSVAISGYIQGTGGTGASIGPGYGTAAGGTGGFAGGFAYATGASNSYQGEGHIGPGGANTAANGTGGGGGDNDVTGSSGAGGSHASSGGNSSSNHAQGATATSGAADLTSITFGGGGGGGRNDGNGGQGEGVGGGGAGGKILMVFAKNISGVNSITINGGYGGQAGFDLGSGGSGAGGAVLLVCQSASIGTGVITAAGGPSITYGGGYGGTGRIAIHHSLTITGSTNPTYTNVVDPTIRESSMMFII